MPWRETCAMDERMRFIVEHERGEAGIADLGAEEAAGLARPARARGGVAGREHGRRAVETRRADGLAPAASAGEPDRWRPAGGLRRGERRLVRGLQWAVPNPGRRLVL